MKWKVQKIWESRTNLNVLRSIQLRNNNFIQGEQLSKPNSLEVCVIREAVSYLYEDEKKEKLQMLMNMCYIDDYVEKINKKISF